MTDTPIIFNRIRRGFTLIEILVVIAIIALLIAILIPAMGHFRGRAVQTATIAQLNAIQTGLTAYATDFNGTFPPSNLPVAIPGWPAQHRGPALLAQGLMGYLPYNLDGAGPGNTNFSNDPAYGFRTRQSAMGGKVYGPYVPSDAKGYKLNAAGQDESFYDAWGHEILYYHASGLQDTPSPSLPAATKLFDLASNNDSIFYSDDCSAPPPTTPPVLPVPAPPDPSMAAKPAFYGQLYSGTTNAINTNSGTILGSNSYLLISAGEDGIYFTADDIVQGKQ